MATSDDIERATDLFGSLVRRNGPIGEEVRIAAIVLCEMLGRDPHFRYPFTGAVQTAIEPASTKVTRQKVTVFEEWEKLTFEVWDIVRPKLRDKESRNEA